ncbi:MAG: RHS repeat-associated core domain-containing protein [Planctomycetota bacterium]
MASFHADSCPPDVQSNSILYSGADRAPAANKVPGDATSAGGYTTLNVDPLASLSTEMLGWVVQLNVNQQIFAPITNVDLIARTLTVAGEFEGNGGTIPNIAPEGSHFRIFAPPGTTTYGANAGVVMDPYGGGSVWVGAASSRCLYGGYRYEPSAAGVTQLSLSQLTVTQRQGGESFGGLYYTLHRHYDPVLMRFTSPDPAASPFFNLHAYVGNNPARFFDPDGLEASDWELFKSATLTFFQKTGEALLFVPRNAARTTGNLWDGTVAAVQGDWDGVEGAWNTNWAPINSMFSEEGVGSVTEKFTVSYYEGKAYDAACAYHQGDAQRAGQIWGEASFDAVETASIVVGGAQLAGSLARGAGRLAAGTGRKILSRTGRVVGGTADDAGRLLPVMRQSRRGGFLLGPKVHKNSLAYVGDTHVYVIRGPRGIHKVGESAQGVRVRDGASIRGERQSRALNRHDVPGHYSDVRKWFPGKASARAWETRLIERYRRMYGQGKLPGNKGNR